MKMNGMKTPRGIRNCNPGNLRLSKDRWKGLRPVQTDKEFFQFEEMKWGYRALMRTLQNYRRVHGCRNQEWKFGKREESVVYALHSFFRKLAQGVGPAAVIAIMGTSLIGYDSALGTIGQSAETASRLCWLVAGLYLFSAVTQFIGNRAIRCFV